MHSLTDNGFEARREAFGVTTKIQQEVVARITRNIRASAPGDDEVQQFAHLCNITLAADALRGYLVAFEENGVAPINDLQFVIVAIPKKVLGVHVVVDNVVTVGSLQKVEESVDDDQHFQF